jgi:hypothetical protein
MISKLAFVLIAALVVLGLGTLAAPAAAKGSFYFDFENDSDPWIAQGSDIFTKYALNTYSGENGCADLYGISHARLQSSKVVETTSLAAPRPGATWMVASFPAAQGPHAVSVRWSARDIGKCENCFPIIYVGDVAPTHAAQFEQVSHSALKQNWNSYNYDGFAWVVETYAAYVAIGWSGSDATIGFDCVTIEIYPVE